VGQPFAQLTDAFGRLGSRKSCHAYRTKINNILVKSTNCNRECKTADSAPKSFSLSLWKWK